LVAVLTLKSIVAGSFSSLAQSLGEGVGELSNSFTKTSFSEMISQSFLMVFLTSFFTASLEGFSTLTSKEGFSANAYLPLK
jgi:hypothetical protein